MREINVSEITDVIEKLCIDANLKLPSDVVNAIKNGQASETKELPCKIFETMMENLEVAEQKQIPICQDTGMAIIFIKVGQDVHLTGGNLNDAINEGVRRGYINGYLRLSIVEDPMLRVNTNDNTPAVIHTEIVDGDKVEIMVMPKGFGSENMSAMKMFTPSATKEDIINFVVKTCVDAGSNPCPPIVVGVGLGGSADKAGVLAKEAILRDLDTKHELEFYSEMEDEILKRVNESDIGPQGLGGKTTALSVAIKTYPTHIAGLPCVVNIGCHVTRHKSAII